MSDCIALVIECNQKNAMGFGSEGASLHRAAWICKGIKVHERINRKDRKDRKERMD